MFDFVKARVVGVTTPQVDFIPNTEGIVSYCARVSNPSNQQNFTTSAKLLKYCMDNHHWSVFDMVNIVVEVEVPRDIARQMIRHGSVKFQEFSQRYAEAQNFVLREARMQDSKNRQNSVSCKDVGIQDEWERRQNDVIALVKEHYKWAIDSGVAKECARVILPEGNTMSYLYANMTLRSLITYCNVRRERGVTQLEHVDLADKIWNAALEHFPFLAEMEQDKKEL